MVGATDGAVGVGVRVTCSSGWRFIALLARHGTIEKHKCANHTIHACMSPLPLCSAMPPSFASSSRLCLFGYLCLTSVWYVSPPRRLLWNVRWHHTVWAHTLRKGVNGKGTPHPWDVPLELRCASDDALSNWSTSPDYLFNVSWYRPIPYDPARPWQDKDGMWYQLLSMDGCNATTRALPCEAGGQLQMWKSPALRGSTAKWEHVGAVFTSNATVLGDGSRGHLTKEFVTIDFLGTMAGDPDPAGGTKVFLNNVGGNGGGEGCCSGTTSYFPLTQSAPGAVFEQAGPQGMVDWGSFLIVRDNAAPFFQNGAKNLGFRLCFPRSPSTKGAGCKTRLEPRFDNRKVNPICFMIGGSGTKRVGEWG